MSNKELIHVRISHDMLKELEILINNGLFSNKNEVLRSGIRNILLKYHKLIKNG